MIILIEMIMISCIVQTKISGFQLLIRSKTNRQGWDFAQDKCTQHASECKIIATTMDETHTELISNCDRIKTDLGLPVSVICGIESVHLVRFERPSDLNLILTTFFKCLFFLWLDKRFFKERNIYVQISSVALLIYLL